jgi:hypothetical protein
MRESQFDNLCGLWQIAVSYRKYCKCISLDLLIIDQYEEITELAETRVLVATYVGR